MFMEAGEVFFSAQNQQIYSAKTLLKNRQKCVLALLTFLQLN